MSNIKAKELLEETLKYIPRATQTLSKCYNMWVMGDHFPVFAESQSGCELTSVDGDVFIDLMGGLGPNFLDYKLIKKDIIAQLNKGICFSLPTELELKLAKLICEVYPGAEMVKFGKNGSDVTSAAIRCARSYSKKDYILSASGHYHGWSDQFASASERNAGFPSEFGKYVERFEYNNLKDAELKISSGKYACVIVEPVSLTEPNKGFLQGIRDLCDKYNTIFVLDELITGFRFSLGGASEYFGVIPDLATFGKAISSGFPLSAVCGKAKYMKEFETIFFSGTYLGDALSLQAGISTIEYLKKHKDSVYSHVWRNGNKFKRHFKNTCKRLGIEAEAVGMAPRINVKFNYDDPVAVRDLWHQEMIKNGVFTGIQIYITPMIKSKNMKKILNAMEKSLEVVSKAIKENNVEKYLDGEKSVVIFKRQ